MGSRRDEDNTVRISIVPSAESGGFTVSTAYQGWKLVESAGGSRQGLVDMVLEHLGTVMPGDPADEIRFVPLGPSDS